jgi:hypothetical protein
MKIGVYQTLQNAFYSMISSSCANSNLQCLQQLPVSSIMAAQDNFVNTGYAYSLDPSVGTGEPIRPHFDGNIITNTLTTDYPGTKKPILMTSNKNDAGQVVGESFSPDLDVSYWADYVEEFVGPNRLPAIGSSHYYNPTDPALTEPYIANGDVVRQVLERDGTDQIWRLVFAAAAEHRFVD